MQPALRISCVAHDGQETEARTCRRNSQRGLHEALCAEHEQPGTGLARAGCANRRQSRAAAGTALRLARYFKTTVRFWLNLQTKYDLDMAEDEQSLRKSSATCGLLK
jgi:hypothetical protein